MKKLTDILFSMVTTVVLLGIFAAAIGYATFAENANGTPYARDIVYNAGWFNLLLILLIVNMIGSIGRYKLYPAKRFGIFLFHSAFIVILIGAAVTRWTGSEGILHLREGQTTDEISSDKVMLRITAEYDGKKTVQEYNTHFSPENATGFNETLETGDKSLLVESQFYVPNAVETLEEDSAGLPAFDLFVMGDNGRSRELILTAGDVNEVNGLRFAFADSSVKADLHFVMDGEQLLMTAPKGLARMSMMEAREEAIAPGVSVAVAPRTIYKAGALTFVMKKFITHGKRSVTQYAADQNKMNVMVQPKNAVVFHLNDGQSSQTLNVMTAEGEASAPATCMLNGMKVTIEYGNLPQKLPFAVTLKKFELERYPGSDSPSSYASEISVTDPETRESFPYRIYMNNILTYRGYRFFQSSYDNDEKGTVLSVNHDYFGTLITYAGYALLLLGMMLTLFNRHSRFHQVIKLSKSLKEKRRAGLGIVLLCLSAGISSFAAGPSSNLKNHLDALSSLLVQDEAQGRVEPLSTYAADVVRKITKKTSWKGQSPLEVFIGLCSNPEKWEKEALIKVGHDELAAELKAVNGYVSFDQLIDFSHNGGTYLLADKVNEIYQKDPSTRNLYEKEIINVDERFNILNNVFMGSMLNIFPDKAHPHGKWVSASMMAQSTPSTSMSGDVCPVSGKAGKTDMPATESNGMMAAATSGDACPVSGKTGKTDKPTTATGTMPEGMKDAMSGDVCPVSGQSGKTDKPATETTGTESKTGSCPACGNPMHQESTMGSMLPDEGGPATPESMLHTYFSALDEGYKTGNWTAADNALAVLKSYQQLHGGDTLPDAGKIKTEVFYNNLSIFLTLAILYGLIGLLLIGLHLWNILKYNPKTEKYLQMSIWPLGLMFAVYTGGLALRWYISGHAPWSNGYEAMIFVGWGTTLAGLIFAHRNPITLAITSLLAATALSVAGMSWMNPEITNLVPVLKSYWLVVHVAVITSSYGFLATGAMLAFFNLILMSLRNAKNRISVNYSIQEFSYIIELTLTIGLFMLTIGTFLGGVWANESWGRYWGWDSKETWALVSVLVYAIVLHLRKIPKCNNLLVFNIASLCAISSVIMTFVGVNYYLSGMHSYGQGTPPPVPSWIYGALLAVVIVIAGAIINERKKKSLTENE